MKTLQPHIKCKKGDVGQYAIIPGDPARVRLIAKHFKNPKEIAFNREFLTITGEYKGIRITATSTGIGCPSAAIAVLIPVMVNNKVVGTFSQKEGLTEEEILVLLKADKGFSNRLEGVEIKKIIFKPGKVFNILS